MGSSANRIAYAYLRQEESETQEKNSTVSSSKSILRRLLNLFHKFGKSNHIEV